jgi:hypothetical protein
MGGVSESNLVVVTRDKVTPRHQGPVLSVSRRRQGADDVLLALQKCGSLFVLDNDLERARGRVVPTVCRSDVDGCGAEGESGARGVGGGDPWLGIKLGAHDGLWVQDIRGARSFVCPRSDLCGAPHCWRRLGGDNRNDRAVGPAVSGGGVGHDGDALGQSDVEGDRGGWASGERLCGLRNNPIPPRKGDSCVDWVPARVGRVKHEAQWFSGIHRHGLVHGARRICGYMCVCVCVWVCVPSVQTISACWRRWLTRIQGLRNRDKEPEGQLQVCKVPM